MYSGELEVQAKRKAIAVLQDEINRILNASRELGTLTDSLMKKDKKAIKNTLEQISTIEEEVESLRRKITREVADVGGLIMNRENLLNTAYTMDDKTIDSLTIELDEVYKLNEIIRSLNTNTANAIELAQETQTIEREIDIKYREATIKLLNEVKDPKELLLIKDVIEGIEEMSDKCQRVSDSFILLALSL